MTNLWEPGCGLPICCGTSSLLCDSQRAAQSVPSGCNPPDPPLYPFHYHLPLVTISCWAPASSHICIQPHISQSQSWLFFLFHFFWVFFSTTIGSFLFPSQLFFFLKTWDSKTDSPSHLCRHPNLPCQSPPSVPFRCLKTDTNTGRRACTAAPHLFEIHIKGYTSLSHTAQLPAPQYTHTKANTLSALLKPTITHRRAHTVLSSEIISWQGRWPLTSRASPKGGRW